MADDSVSIDLDAVLQHMVTVAKLAGTMILAARPSAEAAGTKKNSTDLVTETDRAVEKEVFEKLREGYPSFEFMGEETYTPGTRLSASPTFIVDPIDGTTNFVHGNPYVSISIGLSIAREPVAGVVYNPFTGHLFSAARNRGAHLTSPTHGRVPLPMGPGLARTGGSVDVDPLTALDKCLVIVEWGSERTGNDYDIKLRAFRNLTAAKADGGAMVHGLRSFGSAALNLCAVAAGWADLSWESGCWAWDLCAGWVILTEAGGRIVDANPGRWEVGLEERRCLAVRAGDGWKGVVEEFWGCVEGRLQAGEEMRVAG
ncbi:Inositol-1-monophosphatase [Drechslerella dactyloides]|uniref:Inositol-1-monophosphatase n=1 Tax=Drechslerella dactyloides TaxID=74499 RepID=A0AAD6ISH6_DREDA|nr:Inositol-1-monophosphatase [Drechslerella dactyloides]